MLILGRFFCSIFSVSKGAGYFFKWDKKAVYSLMGIGAAPVFISLMSVLEAFSRYAKYDLHSGFSNN